MSGGLHFVWSLGNCGSSPHSLCSLWSDGFSLRCERDKRKYKPILKDPSSSLRYVISVPSELAVNCPGSVMSTHEVDACTFVSVFGKSNWAHIQREQVHIQRKNAGHTRQCQRGQHHKCIHAGNPSQVEWGHCCGTTDLKGAKCRDRRRQLKT